jgi:1,4-alpha-glucan branching enzyme
MPTSRNDYDRILRAQHDAPHRVLGPHRSPDGSSVIVRAFFPHADRANLHVLAASPDNHAMRRIAPEGLFEATVSGAGDRFEYQFRVVDAEGSERRLHDPYAFTDPWFTDEDERLFVDGKHVRLFEKLGAQLLRRRGVDGAGFAVWAPHALRVSVVGTFNRWDGRCHPMRRLTESGIWDLFIPDVVPGELYKFEIAPPHGRVFLKTDPFAFRTEESPHTAAIVYGSAAGSDWADARWMRADRARSPNDRGLAVYRLDLDGFLQTEALTGQPLSLVKLATPKFLAGLKKEGFTHIEPACSLPGYWGSASAFAPGGTFGGPDGFMRFIAACHRGDMGVVLRVLGSEVPKAYTDLTWFDATQLYEASDPLRPESALFSTGKGEVRSFLLSHAFFWRDRYHVDGWRTDCKTALLYRALNHLVPEIGSIVPIVVDAARGDHSLSAAETECLVKGRHDDPHSVLGTHYSGDTRELTVRALIPDAEQVSCCFAGEPAVSYDLARVHPDGLYATTLVDAEPGGPYRLSVRSSGKRSVTLFDPYVFRDFTFSAADQQLFGAGNHYRINEKLGAHARTMGSVSGVSFAVWAPNAEGVSVVGPFNGWDGRRHQLHRHGLSGVWEIFLPGLPPGTSYKYEIRARSGATLVKCDPYAVRTEAPSGATSIVYPLDNVYSWQDDAWMARRRTGKLWQQPVAIYEVHVGSWMRTQGNRSLSYRELAKKLIPYVKDLGFTHIELLPITEYPYEPSWGYQVTGYYAPTSRYGRPEDLMQLIDRCHQEGIGVILDWVAGHFPKDAHGLAKFDGTCLYEHADPRQGEHRDWGTLVFNYGRHEVENFLIANARFWLEHYHFDGLRVDAVASMLYLDYSRPNPGEWIPNRYGGRENLEAIEFLKHTNVVVHREFPGVMMIAEESTSWPDVSRPVDGGGLGFGYKWNMGWMHDVLEYMNTPPEQRAHHHDKLTFGLVYAFSENYVLSLSHDEVVHLKGSLLNKMPGSPWEKFANLRLLYTFMYAHPGKKLLFMGAEFGQIGEWNHDGSLEWPLLKSPAHQQLMVFVKELNRLYRSEPAFYEADFKGVGFEWLQNDNAEQSIIAFLRKARDPRDTLLYAMNFSAVSRPSHRIGVPFPVCYREILNSNDCPCLRLTESQTTTAYEAEDVQWNGREFSITLRIPALTAVVLKPSRPAFNPDDAA